MINYEIAKGLYINEDEKQEMVNAVIRIILLKLPEEKKKIAVLDYILKEARHELGSLSLEQLDGDSGKKKKTEGQLLECATEMIDKLNTISGKLDELSYINNNLSEIKQKVSCNGDKISTIRDRINANIINRLFKNRNRGW